MRSTIWRNRNFLLLWGASSVSEVGSQLTALALPLTALLVLHATVFQVGILAAAADLPYLAFALAAGVFVDRARLGPVLIGADLGRAVLLLSIPVAYAAGRLGVGQLFVVAFATGSLSVVFGVAEQAALHGTVEQGQLINANAKLALSQEAASVAGPGLGGVLIAAISAPATILLDSVSFLVSAAMLWRVRWAARVNRAAGPRDSFLLQVKQGLGFIGQHPVLRPLAMSLAILNLFEPMFLPVALVFMARELRLSPSTIGLVLAFGGIGGALAAASLNYLTRRFGAGRVIVAGVAPIGLLLVPLAPARFPLPWLLVGVLVSAFEGVTFNTTQVGLRQGLTPRGMQGRMTASMRFLIRLTAPIGAVLGGALGSTIGIRPTLFVGALGMLLAIVPLLFSPLPRIFEAPPLSEAAPSGDAPGA
ncbi:MAG: MFS transporter [Candidatus Dormibacteria bacterium]